MIIGISGKLNSGKDTVGEIVQIISASPHFTDEAVLSFIGRQHLNSKWVIKKFADKLKDIVCMLLGCTREQLEDREFKEKELEEEWDRYVLKVDVNSHFIFKLFLSEKEAFEYKSRFFSHNLVYEIDKIKLTPRLLLQLLGTECGRQIIHPNIWCNSLMSEYNPVGFDYQGSEGKNIKGDWEYPNWIITDMRFPNELKAVKDRAGITIRVNRDDTCNCGNSTDWKYDTIKDGSNRYCKKCNQKQTIKNEHESETSLDSAIFDYTIENDSDLISLVKKVRIILKKEQLI